MSDTQLSGIDLGSAEEIFSRLGKQGPDDPIPILQPLQDAYGYLPVPVLTWVSGKTGIPTSRIHGVTTSYSQFYTKPRGRHIIKVCEGTACHVKGSTRIAERISEELKVEPSRTIFYTEG